MSKNNDDRPRTRQEVYDRIRESSKEEFILEDMIRLGFWPAEGQVPGDPGDEIRRRGELQRALAEARSQHHRLASDDAARKELLKRRLQAARDKRKETRAKNAREREARRAAWQARKGQEILFLGTGVSGGLNHGTPTTEGEARLKGAGLPVLGTAPQVAAAMGISIPQLRFLCHARAVSTVSHYKRFRRPKKTGGERLISAPQPKLKAAQTWVLRNVLEKVVPHEAAHGFRAGRSILSNAALHVGQQVVVNVDLKDFFPTLGYRRVRGLFRALGYPEAAATVFSLLCTEPQTEEVELDGKRYFVAVSERRLPQGAPTSPAITNVLCRRLDRRLTGMAKALGFRYTRYADDLTFSGSGASAAQVGRLLRRLADIVKHEGFVIHPDKTRVLRRGRRQEVTGLVVNDKAAVPRELRRRLRAVLFQLEKDGPAGKRWGEAPGAEHGDVIAAVLGYASHLYMVDPARGGEALRRARALWERHSQRGARTPEPSAASAPAAAAAPTPAPPAPHDSAPPEQPPPPKKKWWKLW